MRSLPSTDNFDIPWWRTKLGSGEIEHLTHSIQQEYISQGPKTLELEETIARELNIPYVTTVTSGSVALFLALLATGIGTNDEVIIPNYTFIATAHAVQLTGAKPVFVDTRSDIPVMDTAQLQKKLTRHTKAILPVHINGRAVNMKTIQTFAQTHDLTVIEDAAQAIFSQNEQGYLGTQSDIGCFSMGMAKLVASGQGGILVTPHSELDQRLKKLRNHGHIALSNIQRSGLNFKYTDLLATIALIQLQRVPARINHLKRIYSLYNDGLSNHKHLKVIPVNLEKNELPIYAEVLCSDRADCINYLAKHGIQARPFHMSLNQEAHLSTPEHFANSLKWEQGGLILPCGPEQPLENVKKVIEVLNHYQPD